LEVLWEGLGKTTFLLPKNVKYPDKPVIVSEFGAGAKAGHHCTEQFTEEYQARIYKEQLAAMKKSPSIQGMTPWILMDFRAPLRENRYQRGFNLKGLVDKNRRTRKKAFAVYKAFRPPST
jgi:beta-glucuronidase